MKWYLIFLHRGETWFMLFIPACVQINTLNKNALDIAKT